ncbi:inosine/uridine-preferring nucleoside hydrolase [Rhodopirellula maiorica SM1]|uniref:Inosine/uridine-preferring nucleoside hydrolase n=1 Tax=Rhodopirellula maiorica SM1 TaxID=1265738 RepID=M5R7D3_9BACT|nr:nucleoside hydrolase [Rhodopirellula maiorica]EMI15393.1 inosine/uridine-preferring nucleoside hydrolase [Rhodopirellula maiorica SM1]
MKYLASLCRLFLGRLFLGRLFLGRLFLSLLFLSLLFLATTSVSAADSVPVIFDTDMADDCDDAGALAVLNELADRGEAKLLAVITNRADAAGLSAAASDAINTFYGRGDVPIATDKDGAKVSWNHPSSYTPALATEFPHDCPTDKECPDAIRLYRETLAAADDHSVVICSVGALSNLEDLLNSSGDQHSPLSGEELILAKVKRTVIMGGHFPRSAKPETNLRLDPAAAVSVTNRWPGEIIWQGFEVGAALRCGTSLQTCDADNPVRRAFELRPYLGGAAIDHGKPAHDQAAVLLAVRGVQDEYWMISPPGRVIIDSDGHSEWRTDRKKQHRYVAIKGRPERLEKQIDELMVRNQVSE